MLPFASACQLTFCKACTVAFYHLHIISCIKKLLSVEDTKTLIHAFITLHIHYCHNLLYGLPALHLHKLKRILNAAARLICSAPCHCHIPSLLRDLHWLPIKEQVHFTMLLFTIKAIKGCAPLYIRDLISVTQQGSYNFK